MRRILRSILLALAIFAATTDGVLTYRWMWVVAPGQRNGGFWSLIAIEPYFGY